MSFYDDASLVFLPSGGAGKDTKAYSIKPTDGSGDFTFSRGSNLTSTRVDSNGLIEKGRENLLLQSNKFDTTWTTGATLTSGQSGYDGSSDAWLIDKISAFQGVEQSVSVGGVWTLSVYAKEGSLSELVFRLTIGGANESSRIDLSLGEVISTGGSNIDTQVQSIGDGWYRCSIAASGSLTNISLRPDTNSSSGSIYIQDAQLEQGLVATEYIESGATTGKAGILEDSPRFDYSGGASCPSLLLEPSRTNLIEYSEYFEGTGWTAQAGITLTPNTTETLSPEGLNNAYKVVSTDATKGFYFGGLNVTNAAVRTIYLKGSVGGETIVFKDPSGFGTPSSKTLTTDWQRFEMATTNDGNTYQGLFIDDISVGTIYAYGAQVELGSYPTSYIPNHSGGSVTRNADECTKTSISGLIGQTEGTILCEFTLDELGYDVDFLAINNSTNSEYIAIFKYANNVMRSRVRANSINNTIDHSITATGTYKVALKYNRDTFALFINGVKINEISATISFTSTIERIFVGPSLYVGLGKAKYGQLLTLSEALSDANCVTLTS